MRSYKTNSTSQRRSESHFADRFRAGHIASIASFHRTASAKVFREWLGSMPFQSGNSKSSESWSALSVGGAGALQFFINFRRAMLENCHPKLRVVQVEPVDENQLYQIIHVFEAAHGFAVLKRMALERNQM